MTERPTDEPLEGGSLLALARYLSDEIPPMLAADAAERVLAAPEAVVQTVRTWIASQYAGSGNQPFSDYVFHSIKKLHLLAELELVARTDMHVLLQAVIPVLIEDCPAGERSALLRSLEVIGREDSTLSSPVEFLHRPGRSPSTAEAVADRASPAGAPPRGATPPRHASGELPPPAVQPASSPAEVERSLVQLNVLLDRFDSLLRETAPPQGASQAPPAAPAGDLRRQALLAEIIDRIAADVPSSSHLASQLAFLDGLGMPVAGGSLIRQLGQGLPDWVAPVIADDGRTHTAAPLRAIRRVVGLSRGSDEGLSRFSELVDVAVEEFNAGHLGRAATLFELVSRMIADGEVDSAVVRAVVGQSFAKLDQEHLRTEAEHDENHAMLRRVVAFFPQLSAEELLLELEVESKRDRRRFLIEVLRIHGATARRLALKALRDSVSGERPLSWYVERNMIHLLRRVPRPPDDPLEHEVEVLVKSSELEGPLPLVRESLAGLGYLNHPAVEKALIARVTEIEEALTGKRELPHDADELRGLLDRVVTVLAGRASADARRCVVEHGLRRRAALGDPGARMATLGRFNLADQPTVVTRLLDALRAELPTRVFGVTVVSARRAELVERLIESLAGTDTTEVRAALAEIASTFAGQKFADRAHTVLGALGTVQAAAADVEEDSTTSSSLAGDVEVFGLPNLLQNLADNRLTGVLEIEDHSGQPVAVIRFAGGSIAAASTPRLRGEAAIFELVEHPRSGRFAFTSRALEESELSGAMLPLTPLLLEGMRRFDELAGITAVVPDGMRFKALAAAPRPVPDETDEALVATVWEDAVAGRVAAACGATARVDDYRSRRLLARWVEAGALKPVQTGEPRA